MNSRLSIFVVNFAAAPIGVYIEASLDVVIDGPIVVGAEIDKVFSTMKTDRAALKTSQKVRAVTYHMTNIQDCVTPLHFIIFLQNFVLLRRETMYVRR